MEVQKLRFPEKSLQCTKNKSMDLIQVRRLADKEKIELAYSYDHFLCFFPLWTDSELSQHSAADSEVDVSEKDMKELKGNKMLSMEAKNVLSDLELDSDDESGRYFSLFVKCNFKY